MKTLRNTFGTIWKLIVVLVIFPFRLPRIMAQVDNMGRGFPTPWHLKDEEPK